MPRTMSSSARRAQSSASFFRRNVLIVVGHPVLRITAFHVPEGVLTMVAIVLRCSDFDAHCTEIVPATISKTKKGVTSKRNPLILLVGLP
jgi:hypothetical protein